MTERIIREIKLALKSLKYRQTGDDPKTNGFAYFEVSDWQARQWLEILETSVKCTHETPSDETDEEGNRYCTKCGEWQKNHKFSVIDADQKGKDDG